MSLTPEMPTWVPADLNFTAVANCSGVMTEVAKRLGFEREVYVAAIAQMAEATVGLEALDDIDSEVLRFVAYRLRAVADAIDRSAN